MSVIELLDAEGRTLEELRELAARECADIAVVKDGDDTYEVTGVRKPGVGRVNVR